jgi:hypothetical protein
VRAAYDAARFCRGRISCVLVASRALTCFDRTPLAWYDLLIVPAFILPLSIDKNRRVHLSLGHRAQHRMRHCDDYRTEHHRRPIPSAMQTRAKCDRPTEVTFDQQGDVVRSARSQLNRAPTHGDRSP